VDGLPALGIGGERRKELCAVERSTVANAEPRKARPLHRLGKRCRGNAQIKKRKNLIKQNYKKLHQFIQTARQGFNRSL